MSRILITDDDAMMLRMAGFIVKKAGHEAVTASSGDECLEKMKASILNILILNTQICLMPID
jgi:CheY-like chemotaxis protein